MRLVNYGAGEICDRLSILALKILFGAEKGKDTKHFVIEQAALLTQIRSRTLNGKWFDSVIELTAVNAMLWHAEDALRARRSAQLLDIAATEIAFRIQALNDQRAELIHTINTAAGDAVGQEKL